MTIPGPGTTLPPVSVQLTRLDLVRYCGASGDFNPLHWSERHARAAGLPTVIAHGMLTMGAALRAVTDWCRDPGRVVAYEVRFAKPVPVPDDDAGTRIDVTAVVDRVEDGDRVVVALTVTSGGEEVLTRAYATVRWDG